MRPNPLVLYGNAERWIPISWDWLMTPRVGSAVVVRRGDEILVGRRAKEPNRGKWVFPGGRIEPFEPIVKAAERELREEAGLRISVGDQIGAFEIIVPPSEHRIIIFSWATPLSEALSPGDDISELRYCTKEELATLDLSDIVARVARAIGWLEEKHEVLAA
jgi:8-oxo-dGTP diphosphatase